MKARLIPILAAVVLTTTTLIAQPAPDGPGGRGRMSRESMTDYLQLTADQQTQWETMHKAFADANKPLMDKERDLHQQLDASLEATSPDPTAIGNIMLQIKANGDQMKAAHKALDQKLETILTADQKAKYESFLASAPARRPGPPSHRQ